MRRGAVLLLLLLSGAPARAAGPEFFGELELGGTFIAATVDQLGPDPGASGPCGQRPQTDGGIGIGGVGGVLFRGAGYRHTLAVGAGYLAFLCTSSLTRPVAGLDYGGEHRFGERTALRPSLRLGIDAFSRTLDIISGAQAGAMAGMPGMPSGPVAGKLFLLGSAGIEVEHQFDRRYGVRAGVAAQTMQLLGRIEDLASYATIGPMEAAEFSLVPHREGTRDRLELLLRYQVSHYYSPSQLGVRSRFAVPSSHDAGLSAAWERRFSPRFTLRGEAGLAVAYQPNLCLPPPPIEPIGPGGDDVCSIDSGAAGIRGRDGAPPLELALGRPTTGTFVGALALRYQGRENRFELQLERAYEPSYYASALTLVNRLGGTGSFRVLPDLLLRPGVQLSHITGSSPGRVVAEAPQVSPQNRTLYMTVFELALDWNFWGPLSLFVHTTAEGFWLRGERVSGPPPGDRRVPGFPESGYQTSGLGVLLVGLRVFYYPGYPGLREAALLPGIKALPPQQ